MMLTHTFSSNAQRFCLVLLVAEEKELFKAAMSKLEQQSTGLDRFFREVWTAHPHLRRRKDTWIHERAVAPVPPSRTSSSSVGRCADAAWEAILFVANAVLLHVKSCIDSFSTSIHQTLQSGQTRSQRKNSL